MSAACFPNNQAGRRWAYIQRFVPSGFPYISAFGHRVQILLSGWNPTASLSFSFHFSLCILRIHPAHDHHSHRLAIDAFPPRNPLLL